MPDRSLILHRMSQGALRCALVIVLVASNAFAQSDDLWEIHMNRGFQALAASQLEEARSRFEAAVRFSEGEDDPDRASTSLIALGDVLRLQGEISKAIATVKRAQQRVENIPGIIHGELAVTLNNLAGLYDLQGQVAEAESLYLRSLTIREKFGANTPNDLVALLNNVGSFYQRIGDNARAEPHLRRALSIVESGVNVARETQVALFSNLAFSYERRGEFENAEAALTHTIQLAQAIGPAALELSTAQHNLGTLKLRTGASSQARGLLESALAARRSALGDSHADVALTLYSLAAATDAQGDVERALSYAREAARILQGRLQRLHKAHSQWALAEQRSWRSLFQLHLELLRKWRTMRGAVTSGVDAEAFDLIQMARASDTGNVVLGMSARFAAGNDELANVVRLRQDLLVSLNALDEQLVRAHALDERQRTSMQRRLRSEIAQAEKRLTNINADLSKRFPEFEALTSNAPMRLSEAQRLLYRDEAFVSLSFAETEGFAFVVTAKSAQFATLGIGRREVERLVANLRSQLDPESSAGRWNTFPTDVAHNLYRRVMEPLAPSLVGVRHLVVVPDTAIEGLPLSVLITEAPKENVDLAAHAWLARRFAVSLLPTIGAMRSLRAFARKPSGDLPFVAFADPALGGDQQPSRNFGVRAAFKDGPIADVSQVRRLARLPETAQEAIAIADTLKADRRNVYLQEEANERRVKSLDLSRFKNVLFATHGLMSGEISALGEPSLVLTPPAQASEQDDGLLTAGEIAKLRLNADWVILSACNTAAADGSGAEGFSGLARAFFYAGARALLVSHWAVESRSTVELTTALFREFATQPALGKAESLRRAILEMIENPVESKYRHPMFWAPFVLVGDGAPSSPSTTVRDTRTKN